MPEEWAPPVVAVVVTSDPGDWFERCLGSLCGQDYPNLALLVVDDGSETDLTGRVAAVEPAAIVRRRVERGGYSAGANEALNGVEGATFFLFCHDDVVLDSCTVRLLVEESFRSNAGVVGPKLVSADHPEQLRQVGLGVNRHGTALARVEPGELDQGQHDETREVFAVPGGCTLVRADLFEALGGYDETISLFGEDVDFCWRAQVAGARVAIAPQARAGHREVAASGARQVGEDPALLARRHELRAALKGYGVIRELIVVAGLAALTMAEALVGLVSGERDRARRVLRAWRWNLRQHRSLFQARRRLREIRQVRDRVIMSRMSRRGRLRRYLRPAQPAAPTAPEPPNPHGTTTGGTRPPRSGDLERIGTWWSRVRRGEVPTGQLVLSGCLVAVGLLGLRDLIVGRLPVIGDIVAMPRGSTMLSQFFGGIDTGTGVHPAPAAYGLVGLLGLVLGNSTALAWKVIELMSLVAGALGVSRLVKPFASSRGRLVAVAAFVGLPLAWNSVGTAKVEAVIALGALPYVISRTARATGLPPFAAGMTASSTRTILGEVAPFGILFAVLLALAPAGLLAAGAAVVPILLACLVSGRPKAAGRAFLVVAGAVLVAGCCCLPWSAEWLQHGASWSAFSGAVPGSPTSPASLLRGHTGPVGAWWGSWGLVIAAGYTLVVARGERLFWSTTWWLSAVAATALAWAGSEGWLGAGGGATAVLTTPAAVLVATLCGVGVAAFEQDVAAREALGWRQAAAALASVCLAAGVVPALGAAVGGRAGLPSEGAGQTLSSTFASARRGYRVLWLGDPRSLPASGWQLDLGTSWYATSTALPGGEQEWPAASPGRLDRLAGAILAAEAGRTADVGLQLAQLGVRYVVIPLSDAPDLPGTQVPPVEAAPPASLTSALAGQQDLVERPVEAGAIVFLNADWKPFDGLGLARDLQSGAGGPATWRDLGLALGLAVWLLVLAEGVMRRRGWDRRPGGALAAPVAELAST